GERYGDIGLLAGNSPIEFPRRHADDSEDRIQPPERSADHGGIGCETTLPVPVTHDTHGVPPPPPGGLFAKPLAQRCIYSEHAEVRSRYEFECYRLHLTVDNDLGIS